MTSSDLGIDSSKNLLPHARAVEPADERESSSCRTAGVALAIIALLVAIGAAALIILSGGPSTPQLFAPGIAFAGLTVSIVVWVTILAVSALCKRGEKEGALAIPSAEEKGGDPLSITTTEEKKTGTLVITSAEETYETTLHELEKLTKEQISSVLVTFGTDRQGAFIEWVLKCYFPKEMVWSSLSKERIEVLKAFAAFPEALVSLPEERIQAAGELFASIILEHIDPKSAKQETIRKFLTTLFTIFIECESLFSVEPRKILARHPIMLAQMMRLKPAKISIALLDAIFCVIDSDAVATFLQSASVVNNDLKSQVNSSVEEKAEYLRKVETCVKYVLKRWFNENVDVQSPGAINLLQEFAHWPKTIAAGSFEFFGSYWLFHEPFMNQLDQAFSPEEKALFVAEMRNHFTKNGASEEIVHKAIQRLAEEKRQTMPEVLLKIYAEFPQEIALIPIGSGDTALHELVSAIKHAMTETNRKIMDSMIKTA